MMSDKHEDPIARSIRVTGHVQGVFFREWTVMMAKELGIVGWVRNLREGAVEIYACGEPTQIEHFIAELYKGSAASRVDDVDSRPAEIENFSGFMRRGTL